MRTELNFRSPRNTRSGSLHEVRASRNRGAAAYRFDARDKRRKKVVAQGLISSERGKFKEERSETDATALAWLDAETLPSTVPKKD